MWRIVEDDEPAIVARLPLIVRLPLTIHGRRRSRPMVRQLHGSDNPFPVKGGFHRNGSAVLLAVFHPVSFGCMPSGRALGAGTRQLTLSCGRRCTRRCGHRLLGGRGAVGVVMGDLANSLTSDLSEHIWAVRLQFLNTHVHTPGGRRCRPAAGAGSKCVHRALRMGVATYACFHMLDYPVGLGLGVWLRAVRDAEQQRLWLLRVERPRWTVAPRAMAGEREIRLSGWVAPIAIQRIREITPAWMSPPLGDRGRCRLNSACPFALGGTPLIVVSPHLPSCGADRRDLRLGQDGRDRPSYLIAVLLCGRRAARRRARPSAPPPRSRRWSRITL